MSYRPKWEAFEAEIERMVEFIDRLCLEHDIAMFMHFELDDIEVPGGTIRGGCTMTHNDGPDDDPGTKRIEAMIRASSEGQGLMAPTPGKRESVPPDKG